MYRCLFVFFGLYTLVCVDPTIGQVTDTAPDSLRSYDLAEIVIVDTEQPPRTPSTVHQLPLASIAQANATSSDEIFRLIPSAHIQTNSRGETLVYLRNAGERQVALFFDGALVQIPWDNRIDFSLLPASVIGGMTVTKGVSSVLYGTNVIGGTITATSRALANPGSLTEATAFLGTGSAQNLNITHLGQTEKLDYTLAFGYASQDDVPLPQDADLPFSQPDADFRTNTDRKMVNLFGRASYRFDNNARLGISLLHLDGEKGIAPESHLDPQASRIRYWRYPQWRNSMVIVNGMMPLGSGNGMIRGAVWGSRFAQTIAQYEDVSYETIASQQEDEDLTLGSRFTLLHPVGLGTLRVALNTLTSSHDEKTESLPADPADPAPTLSYQQHIFSLGSEYQTRPLDGLEITLGASLDGIATPKTGDKPSRKSQREFGLVSGALVDLSESWSVRAAAGRKVRFPTLRELFGEALNRFLVNPDLKPETSLLSEVALQHRASLWSGELVVFYSRTFDTIDQHNVTLPGETRPRRQRINREGSSVFGVEAEGGFRPVGSVLLEGHLTWTNPRLLDDEGPEHLTEKPEWLGTGTLTYQTSWGGSAQVQTIYTGKAYGLQDDGTQTVLPTSLAWNGKLSYRLPLQQVYPTLFVRVNNLTDTVVLPQLGLPQPGRTVRFGLEVMF